MRRRALPDATLRKASSEIRRISGMATPSKLKASTDLFKVQHVENYEDADQLNQLHRPTELGDIYEDTHTRRRYILIAPQCDLMVRTRLGFRGKEYDVLKEAVLAQIVGEKPGDGLGWKLDIYSEDDQFVDFKKTFVTRFISLEPVRTELRWNCYVFRRGKTGNAAYTSLGKKGIPLSAATSER